jgi:hypothetical protein
VHALEYFDSIGLLDPAPAAIVDLGSLLYCQEAINKLCAAQRQGYILRGYYMFLRRRRRGIQEAGPAEAIAYETPADMPSPATLTWLNRSAAIEHVLGIADHPGVRRYSGGGGAEYLSGTTMSKDHFQSIERKLLKYTEQFGACWRNAAQDESLTPILSTILEELFEHPDREVIVALQGIEVDECPLVQPYTWRDLIRTAVPSRIAQLLRTAGAPGRYWPEASYAMTPWHRRWIKRFFDYLRSWLRMKQLELQKHRDAKAFSAWGKRQRTVR